MEYTQAACRRRRRTWAVRVAIAGTGVLALLGLAAPAMADVSMTPSEATQRDAANLVFQITNDSTTASVTAIEVQLPADQPIAEVYPLSVADWAPTMTDRKIDQSVESLHGYQINSVTTAVKWIAMPGKALPPGGKTELRLSIGPLPAVAQLAFGVVITNSDGTQLRWTTQPGANAAAGEHPAPVLALKSAPAGQDAHGAGHNGGASAAAGDQEQDAGTASTPTNSGGTSYGAWILVTLLLIVAISIFSLVRQRTRAAQQAPEQATDEPEPDEEASAEEQPVVSAKSGPAP